MIDPTLLAAGTVVTVAGFMRGVTGFGGAMLMAPPLSYLLGPVPAVVIALMLETAAAFVMFPSALPQIRRRTLMNLTIPACFTVPIGGYFLITLDPVITRKVIAGVVTVFSLILLTGVRYSGQPRPSTSVALGSLVGVLLGATSVGAPPVILYLLSGSDPPQVTRANLTVFVTVISLIGLLMLLTAGVITLEFLGLAATFGAPYLAATWFGSKLFAGMSDQSVRRVALLLMLTVSVVGLAL
ncbi:MAG: sulfite exporter TauE/SafE family protein [Rhodomicrobiaceae bacterium]